MLSTIELFAGAGGLALGIEKPGLLHWLALNLIKMPVIHLEKIDLIGE